MVIANSVWSRSNDHVWVTGAGNAERGWANERLTSRFVCFPRFVVVGSLTAP